MLKTFGKTTVAAAALIASLALAAPASAATETVSTPSLAAAQTVTGPSVTLTSGLSYVLKLSWSGISDAYTGLFKAALVNGAGKSIFSAFATLPASAGSTSTSFNVSAAQAGTYTLVLKGYAGDADYTATGVTGTLTSVPGPVAGAGLSALLGLVGFGFYRRRYAA